MPAIIPANTLRAGVWVLWVLWGGDKEAKNKNMEALIPFFICKPLATFILAAIWSGICFLCGAYIGHRFTLNRDKRKEFNAVADIIRQKLRNQKTIIETGGMPSYLTSVTVEDLGFLVDVTPPKKNRAL